MLVSDLYLLSVQVAFIYGLGDRSSFNTQAYNSSGEFMALEGYDDELQLTNKIVLYYGK